MMFSTEELLERNNEDEIADLFIKEHVVPQEHKAAYHFMAPCGWINDPNGFSKYQGKYHLFYQHYPYAPEWGSMHWGHAISEDLIHWEHLPVALTPGAAFDEDGCYSGSALEIEGQHILMYTGHLKAQEGIPKSHRQMQNLVVGDGVRYEKYKGNPVIGSNLLPEECQINDFRDPKFWHENGQYYLLCGNRSKQNKGQIVLFSSENLTKWHCVGVVKENFGPLGAMWECPDYRKINGQDVLFLSPTEIEPDGLKHTNLRSTVYFVGDFNKNIPAFTAQNGDEIDYGLDFYAPQFLSGEENRTIYIAWMQMWKRNIPSSDFGIAGAMTLPREVTLVNGKLIQQPAREVYTLRKQKSSVNFALSGQMQSVPALFGRIGEINLCFSKVQSGKVELFLAANDDATVYSKLSYDVEKTLLTFDRSHSESGISGLNQRSMSVELVDGQLSLQIFLDRYSLEIFAQGGSKTMTHTIYTEIKHEHFFVSGTKGIEVVGERYDYQ